MPGKYGEEGLELKVPASLMAALLCDPSKMGWIDPTLIETTFFLEVKPRQTWLAYWWQMPGTEESSDTDHAHVHRGQDKSESVPQLALESVSWGVWHCGRNAVQSSPGDPS